jgi:hypothetical protein
VTYRNIDKVHFRAIKYDWKSRLNRQRLAAGYLTGGDRRDLVTRKPELEWSADLAPHRITTSGPRTCRPRRS